MASFFTTMRPEFTGAQNTTALLDDVATANGDEIVVPAGTYLLNWTNFFSGLTINIRMEDGAVISPDGVIANDATIQAVIATNNCTVKLTNFTFDGLSQCDGAVKCVGGTFEGRDISISNIGRTATNTYGTISLGFSGVSSVKLHGYKSRFVQCAPNGVYSDQNGLCRHLWLFNCDTYDISHLDLFDGEGDDYDAIHIQDLRATPTCTGTIKNAKVTISENLRRVAKYQGGTHVLDGLYAPKKEGFTAYSPPSDAGKRNLNAVDWAGNQAGSLTLQNSYIDATSFPVALAKSIAGPADLSVIDTVLYGSSTQKTNLLVTSNPSLGIYWLGGGGGTLTKTGLRSYNFTTPEFDG